MYLKAQSSTPWYSSSHSLHTWSSSCIYYTRSCSITIDLIRQRMEEVVTCLTHVHTAWPIVMPRSLPSSMSAIVMPSVLYNHIKPSSNNKLPTTLRLQLYILLYDLSVDNITINSHESCPYQWPRLVYLSACQIWQAQATDYHICHHGFSSLPQNIYITPWSSNIIFNMHSNIIFLATMTTPLGFLYHALLSTSRLISTTPIFL